MPPIAGITTHLSNGLHVHGYEQHFTAHIRRSGCGFTPGMTCTNHNYIVFLKHLDCKVKATE
jgi:hypothetical protein